MYTNTLTSVSGDDLLVMPSYGKDLILEVSANNEIFFKKGGVTKRFDNLVSDYLDKSFNSLNSQVQYILQEISGASVKDFITSGISNDLLIKSYAGRDIILEVSGNSEIIFKRGDFSYNLDDLIGGGSQSSDYATYNILDITGKIIFTDNSGTSGGGTSGGGSSGGSSNIVLTSISGNIFPSTDNTFKLGDVSKNWSNAYIRDISVSNIDISGNLNPLIANSSSLGSTLKSWSNAYIRDISVSNIEVIGVMKTYKYNEFNSYTKLGETITNLTGGTSDLLGSSVAINDEGNIIACCTQGASRILRIYKYNDISWVKISPDIGEACAVALNSAGNIVAISNRRFSFSSGIIKVYRYVIDNSWVQISQTITLGAADDALSLNSTGNILAIGSPYDNTTGFYSGATRVYKYITDGSWIQLGQTISGETAYSYGGYSVSLNSNGTILAIGASYNNNAGGNYSGQVRIYRFTNDVSWIQISQDIDGTSSDDNFGFSVSLNSDGTLVACGAMADPRTGYVKVYKYISDGNWTPYGQTINGEATNDEFGVSVSLNKQGNILGIGGPYNDGSGNSAGHVRVYKYNDVSWIQIATDIDGDMANDQFGTSIALNGLGNRFVVGAPYGSSGRGYVKVYTSTDVIQTLTSNILPLANNTYTLGSSSLSWSNAYIRDVSASNIDVSGKLNVVGATKLSNSLDVSGNVTFGGSNLYVPSSFTIDPMGHGDNTGTVLINGNLVVQGVTTTINSTVVDISDKMLVLASNASNSLQADGAGFEISGAKVNFLYNNSTATFRSSIGISISGNVVPVTNGSIGETGKNWSNAYIRDVSVTNIEVSGNIIPLNANISTLGTTLKPWSNAYIRDVSATNIEVSGNIVPLLNITSNLGSSLKRWNKVFVDDLSVNTINGVAYSTGSVTLAPNSINSSHIVNNSITNDNFAPLTITGAKIAENTINFSKFDTATNNILNSLALRLTTLENNALIMTNDTIITGTQGNTITIPIDLTNNESVTINFTFKLSGLSNNPNSVYIKYIYNGQVIDLYEARATTISYQGNTYVKTGGAITHNCNADLNVTNVFTIKVYKILAGATSHPRYVMEGEGSYCLAYQGNSRVEFNGFANLQPDAIYITHGTITTMQAKYSIINNKV